MTTSTDFESALITNILDTRDIRTVIRQKVDSGFFFDPVNKAAFIFLWNWYNNPRYGDVPSWESFADNFQNFQPNRGEESTLALCDKLREKRLYGDIAGIMEEVGDIAMGDVFGAFEALKKKIVTLTAMHTVDETSTLKSSLTDIRERYMRMKESSNTLLGYPYPWDALNQATLGLTSEQLVFIYGRPKTCKTWLLLMIAVTLWYHGLRVLIFSQEMSSDELKQRFVAIVTGVNYEQMRRGELPEDVERDFLDNLSMLEEQEDIFFTTFSSSIDTCPTELSAKVDEYRPHVVLVDGVNYLSSDWKEIAEFLRALKRTCQAKKIPIIGSTHANRSRKKTSNLRDEADDFTFDSFFQSCDLALRITSDIEDKKNHQVKVFTSAIREGQSTLFSVHSYLAENLTQKAVEQFEENDGIATEQELDGQNDLPVEAAAQ